LHQTNSNMQNPFMSVTTYTGEEIIINVTQIVFMKKCTDHPNKPGEPELLTEVRLTDENSIYVTDTIEQLYSRIEGL
jgi:hypothetical protein